MVAQMGVQLEWRFDVEWALVCDHGGSTTMCVVELLWSLVMLERALDTLIVHLDPFILVLPIPLDNGVKVGITLIVLHSVLLLLFGSLS